MSSIFTISNISTEFSDLKSVFKSEHFIINYSEENSLLVDDKIFILEGYVLPKFDVDEKFQYLANLQLLTELVSHYPEKWYKMIKGVFVIVIADSLKFEIINDHLGLKSFYYKEIGNDFTISNDFYKCKPEKININSISFAQKALFNREIGDTTMDEKIKKSIGGTLLQFEDSNFKVKNYWSPELLQASINKDYNISYFTKLISKQVSQVKTLLNPKEYCITLTGGKDSRTALAALMNKGIKPFGFTYGNPDSKDAVFAKELAEKANIEHQVFTPPNSQEWLNSVFHKITNQQHPWISLHRAHRLFSFEKTSEKIGKDTAYFAGYMGGELLMGIYYDELVFTKFLTDSWNDVSSRSTQEVLNHSFLKKNAIDLIDFENQIKSIKTLDKNNPLYEREFHGLFEIGARHHSQDIQLASELFKYPIPFFLDIDFLTALFQSKYQFKYTDNKTKNIFKRYKLYKFNLEIQHTLYSELDKIPFAKKGNYTTKEYRKGVFYWSLIKVFRYFNNKQKFPSSYAYNEVYKKYILTELEFISSKKLHPVHSIYDVNKAIKELKLQSNLSQEKYWHRFTNIVAMFHQWNKFI